MRWTPEKVAKLRELAPTGLGGAGIANIMGISYKAVSCKANDLRISIRYPLAEIDRSWDNDGLRARWREMLSAMRAALRDEIQRM